MKFNELIETYRDKSLTEAEKGTRKVWLWRDFPFRAQFGSGHDLGVDLVALTFAGDNEEISGVAA